MLRFCFLYQVLIYDQMIIPGDMGELRAAFHIPQRKDPGHVGFKSVIDRNKPMLIETDPRCGDVETGGIGPCGPEATRTWEAVTVKPIRRFGCCAPDAGFSISSRMPSSASRPC